MKKVHFKRKAAQEALRRHGFTAQKERGFWLKRQPFPSAPLWGYIMHDGDEIYMISVIEGGLPEARAARAIDRKIAKRLSGRGSKL